MSLQAKEVRSVKRSESGMILDPVTLLHTAKVADAKKMMKEFRIGGIPVIDSEGKLIGIVTNRDLRFVKDNNLSVNDVMTKENLIVTKEKTSLAQAEEILQQHKIEYNNKNLNL